jgi:hypothetical protein
MVTGVGTRVRLQDIFSLMGMAVGDWPCARLCVALSSSATALSRDRWLAGRQATDAQGDADQKAYSFCARLLAQPGTDSQANGQNMRCLSIG